MSLLADLLWDSLHKDAPWASNPTVVRLAFKVLP